MLTARNGCQIRDLLVVLIKVKTNCCSVSQIKGQEELILTGLSLRAGGRGFSPATKRVAPGYFYWKIEEK